VPQHTLAVLGAVVAADRAANSWPLAVISFGASWHNSHHAGLCPPWRPARPARPGRPADLAAGDAGWVHDMHWPKPQRFAALPAMNVSGTPEGACRLCGLAKLATERDRQ
jgi:stearoyl-CoA desaturase (delta-9 desaturase)